MDNNGTTDVNKVDSPEIWIPPGCYPKGFGDQNTVMGYKFTLKAPVECTLEGNISWFDYRPNAIVDEVYYTKRNMDLVDNKAYPDISWQSFYDVWYAYTRQRQITCSAKPGTWGFSWTAAFTAGGKTTYRMVESTFLRQYEWWLENGGHIEFDIEGDLINPKIQITRGPNVPTE